MKIALVALLSAVPALANAASITCVSPKNQGDYHYEIIVNDKSRSQAMTISFWETHYQVPASAIVKKGNSIAILGQTVKGSAEGDTISAKVDGLFVYSPKKRTLTTTLFLDGELQRETEVLNCR